MSKELTPIEKSAEARKIMKPEFAAQIDELVSIIQHNKDPFFIANNSFNFGYYQGMQAVKEMENDKRRGNKEAKS